jgi:hypothetical protein
MKRLVLLAGLCSAFTLFDSPAAPAANTNTLIGSWETQLTGPSLGRSTCFLAFSNDFTWTGYGIGLKSFGPITLAGTWGVDAKDRIIGAFTLFSDKGDRAGTLKKVTATHNHLRGRAVATHGFLQFKGTTLATLPDVSGSNWVGEVHTQGNTSFQSYTFTASTNMPGWFDITGSGLGQGGAYTVSGALVVTSDRRANGYLVSDFGSINTTSTWSFTGKFVPSFERAVFRGRQDNGHFLIIHAAKQ